MHGIRYRVKGLLETLCPAEVFLLLLLLLSGVVALFHVGQPDPLSLLLPNWAVVAWDISIIVGALVSMGGLVMLNWLLVRLGYTLTGPAAIAYGLALTPYASTLSVKINVATLFAFGSSCLWRAFQISITLRRQP